MQSCQTVGVVHGSVVYVVRGVVCEEVGMGTFDDARRRAHGRLR